MRHSLAGERTEGADKRIVQAFFCRWLLIRSGAEDLIVTVHEFLEIGAQGSRIDENKFFLIEVLQFALLLRALADREARHLRQR